ncbi:hypothetical protein ACIBLA_25615 [Streptomyces sp. NPDC050433]|uniref:hypothetical protein n=1 Tax=unclassified Streptomyces TaxID=2593676 RepID=UPI003449684A
MTDLRKRSSPPVSASSGTIRPPSTAGKSPSTTHPRDPEVFALDLAAGRRSNVLCVVFVVLCPLLCAGASVTGAVLL